MKRSISILALMTFVIISIAAAEGQRESRGNFGEQVGPGMMGGSGGYGMMGSNGMMGGPGGYGMMGSNGMMGGPGGFGNYNNMPYPPTEKRLTMEQVEENVLNYMEQRRMQNLELNEIMEFQSNFYAQIKESDTGINAFELLIDPYYGYVTFEPGPNMMWNSKYGHMGGWKSEEMSLMEEDAITKAKEFLDNYSSGLSADEHADRFYGYYTLHTIKDGKVEGMLSVNGYSGDVWYHSWHGAFLQMEESTDNHSQ